jgi:uncharacterized protein (DUF4415 family)
MLPRRFYRCFASFPCVELLIVKKRSSSKASKTDWTRVRVMRDRDIAVSAEHSEADVRHIMRGVVRRGLRPVSPKESVSLRVDADVLAWFKAQGPAVTRPR